MSKVAFLGIGAMGSRMAGNLLKAGHAVTVWNRSAARSGPLVAAGAAIAPTPHAAVAGADYAIAMVRDDVASREVWLHPETGALKGLGRDAIAIESSTLTVGWVRILAESCAGAGMAFLDAPVAGSRPQAEAGQLIYLVGGDAATLARAESLLMAMAGAVHHAGEAGAGTAVKLAVNALLGVQVAALAELIGLLRKAGVDAARAVEIVSATPVCSPAAKAAAGSMLAGAFAPLFPVELVAKDFGYAGTLAEAVGAATPVVDASRAVFTRAVAAGMGADNLTGIARLYS